MDNLGGNIKFCSRTITKEESFPKDTGERRVSQGIQRKGDECDIEGRGVVAGGQKNPEENKGAQLR